MGSSSQYLIPSDFFKKKKIKTPPTVNRDILFKIFTPSPAPPAHTHIRTASNDSGKKMNKKRALP